MTRFSSVRQLPDLMKYDIIKSKRTYMYLEEEHIIRLVTGKVLLTGFN